MNIPPPRYELRWTPKGLRVFENGETFGQSPTVQEAALWQQLWDKTQEWQKEKTWRFNLAVEWSNWINRIEDLAQGGDQSALLAEIRAMRQLLSDKALGTGQPMPFAQISPLPNSAVENLAKANQQTRTDNPDVSIAEPDKLFKYST
jgi:hypothetical protein